MRYEALTVLQKLDLQGFGGGAILRHGGFDCVDQRHAGVKSRAQSFTIGWHDNGFWQLAPGIDRRVESHVFIVLKRGDRSV